MTAREELIEALTQGSAHSAEYAGLLIDNLLEEEAEKIRNSPGWCQGEWMDSRDREHAASLIDPHTK